MEDMSDVLRSLDSESDFLPSERHGPTVFPPLPQAATPRHDEEGGDPGVFFPRTVLTPRAHSRIRAIQALQFPLSAEQEQSLQSLLETF